MKTIESIEKRREEIIDEIRKISSMRRGTINEQYLKVPRKDKESSLRGPYYVLTRKENGRTVSTRVRSNELEELKKETEAYKKFNQLSNEFVAIAEELTDKRRILPDEDSKKNS